MTLKKRVEHWNSLAQLRGDEPVWWRRWMIFVMLGVKNFG
jgi:hypothetical protein